MTTDQVRRSFVTGVVEKDVTRRNGWKNVKAGQRLCACEKCQGIKKGEHVKRLGVIRVVSARRENLRALLLDQDYGRAECRREGFPHLSPEQFVEFFLKGHRGVTIDTLLTRIEFAYVMADSRLFAP